MAITYNDSLDNIFVFGWNWEYATGLVGIYNGGGMMTNSGAYNAGNNACELAGTAGTVATMFGGMCLGGLGASMIFGGADLSQHEATYGVYLGQSRGSFGVSKTNASVWYDHGSNITATLNVTAGQAILSGTSLDQFGGGNSALVVSGGTVRLQNVDIRETGGAGINQSGGTIIDGCGNFVSSGTFNNIYTGGVVIGTCSIAGAATNTSIASRNTAIGSTPLIAGNGAGMIWPALLTVRLYAYDSAAGVGCTGNSTVTWTISYTDLTGTAQTQTAVETIVTNGGATGADKLAVTFAISSGNAGALNYSTAYTPGAGCTTNPSYAATITVA